MRVLYLDCFSGISGDMTVGALCDLGVNPSTFEWELSKLDIGDFHMHFERKHRKAIEGVKFTIHEGATHSHDQDEHEHESHECCGGHEHGHAHEHHHECEHRHHHEHEPHAHAGCQHGKHEHAHEHEAGEDHEAKHAAEGARESADAQHFQGHVHSHEEVYVHPAHEGGHAHVRSHTHEREHGHEHPHHERGHEHGRTFAQIRELIEASDLSDFVKKHSISIFNRVAVAEGKVHGQPADQVAFHEVGALDSIADIVCACVGLEQLGVEKILVSPLHDGRGFVECAHGRYPIPATATLEILKGIPMGQIDEPFEFITPTGAAIVAEFGQSFGPMPVMRVEKIGYGVGTRVLQSRPNVLRAVIGELETASGSIYQSDTITRIETNIDDLSAEITGAVVDKLFAAGALDVFLTAIQMKKNRPGVQLTVLCEEQAVSAVADILFKETSSFGIRMDRMERWKLDRRFESVSTPFGEITVKLGIRSGETIQIAPEFESCRAASERTGVPLREIYQSALQNYRAANVPV